MPTESEREMRGLQVKLSPKERAKRASEYAAADEKIDRLAEEKREEGARFKELIDDAVDRKNRLREAVKTGSEERDVECEWRPDWNAKEWLLHRLDTDEIVDRETMTASDLAPEFDYDGDGDANAEPAGAGG